MRVLLRIVAVLLVLVVAAAVGGYFYARPLLETGTGYAAHNSCAVTLVADRDDPDSDLPPNPLVPFLTGYVNEAGKSSTSQILFTLSTQKAWYTRGFGCTVAADRPELGDGDEDRAPTSTRSRPPPPPTMGPEVDEALGRAFGDDLDPAGDRAALGTRAVLVIRWDGRLVAERYAPGFDARYAAAGVVDGRRASPTWSWAGWCSKGVVSAATTRTCAPSGPASGARSPSSSCCG